VFVVAQSIEIDIGTWCGLCRTCTEPRQAYYDRSEVCAMLASYTVIVNIRLEGGNSQMELIVSSLYAVKVHCKYLHCQYQPFFSLHCSVHPSTRTNI
jgi:hypothetical protein